MNVSICLNDEYRGGIGSLEECVEKQTDCYSTESTLHYDFGGVIV